MKFPQVVYFLTLGIETGDVLRYSGKGNFSQGKYGSLFVQFNVNSHKNFRREGDNIITEIEIPLIDALEGRQKVIDSIDGPIPLEIPKGVQPGQRIKLKYKGVKSSKSGKHGDLVAIVNVKLPLLDNSQIKGMKSIIPNESSNK